MRAAWVAAAVVLSAGLAPAQDFGASEQRRLERATGYVDEAERALSLADWDGAQAALDKARWFLERWAEMGLAAEAPVAALQARVERAADKLAKREAAPAEGRVLYVRREGGKKSGESAPERPLKFLYKVLEAAEPGDEVRISGPVYGPSGAGHQSLSVAQVTIKGSYDASFEGRFGEGSWSILSRKPGVDVSSALSHLLVVEAGAGTVLDGLVFDAQHHNRYADGNLVPERSPSWASLLIKARGPVTVRNCVFLNASGPAIDIIGDGEVTIDNCLFLNGRTEAVSCRGSGLHRIRSCSFALLWAERSRPGCAAQLRTGGSLVFEDNVVAFADVGLRSVNNNLNITMNRNVFFALSQGPLQYASGGLSVTASLADLEETEVEAEENEARDPGLMLEAERLLRYLRSSRTARLADEALWERLVAAAEARLPLAEGAEAAPKEEPKEEPGLKDPFAEGGGLEDPFAKPKPESQPEPKEPEAPEEAPKEEPKAEPAPRRKVVPAGDDLAPAYPWSGWVEVGAGEAAGARRPRG